jgi:hypothetical protein
MALRTHREPIERDRTTGVKIWEIEDKVRELYPDFSLDDMRTTSLLFAILREGCSTQKLQWFTKYDREFIQRRVDWLRSRGQLFTGTLSVQYVLDQVPGSEDLVERITGQKIVANTNGHKAPTGYDWEKHVKPAPIALSAPPAFNSNRKEQPMNTMVNGAADEADAVRIVAEVCDKSATCGKPANHMGRCKGDGGSALRARRQAKASKTKAAKAKASSKPARNGHKAQAVSMTTALAAITGDGHYKIEYEDETRQFNFEGIGRESFVAALKAAEASITGRSNG